MLPNKHTETDVKKFIAAVLGAKLEGLTDHVSLFHDLGVDGDDAQEFLFEFSSRFGVSLEQFSVGEYFGAEKPATLLSLFSQIFKESPGKKFKRLEVRDLVEAAATGVLLPL